MEQDGWWPRIRIENGGSGTLSFTIIDQGARVPMVITQTQRCSVEPFLRDATGSINTDDKVGRVLFELLIPPEFKHHAPERRDLVLVVDEHSAIYPWELLEYPTPDGDRALASEASVIRQLALPGQNPGMANLRGRLVVIADPDISGSGYPQLQGAEREGKAVARWNMLHPEEEPRVAYLTRQLQGSDGPVVVATDYIKAYSDQLREFVPGRYVVLGTDGFGRSDTRGKLRTFFEVSREYIVLAALKALADEGQIKPARVAQAMRDLAISADKTDPLTA